MTSNRIDLNRFVCPVILLCTLSLLFMLTGCGGGPIQVDLLSAGGVVTYEDGTFPSAQYRWIYFEPVERSKRADEVHKTAKALIDDQTGKFEMYTVRPGDGVVPGKYNVIFDIYDEQEDGTRVEMVAEEFRRAESTPLETIEITEAMAELSFKIRKP